ncbi:MAG: flippase-like domain-containing protein [Acidobacteriota bacterium]|nr:flippase-like domain-containing protein [Acidobacteriota bacterium]
MKAKFGSWLKHLKTIALVLIVICVLWRLWRGVHWGAVRQSFSEANIFLLASAMVASGATNLLRAMRWRALLKPLIQAGVHDLFAATNIGIGGSFLFGAPVGELIRPLTLSLLKREIRPSVSFLTVMVERLFDLGMLSIFFGLTLLWLPVLGNRDLPVARIRELGMVLLIVPALGVGAMVLLRRRIVDRSKAQAIDGGASSSATSRIRRFTSRLYHQLMGALGLLSNGREFTVVILWTVGLWLANVLTNWLTLRAFGLRLGPKEILLVVCCGLLGSLVPTPGGAAGAFHLAMSGGLIFLGIAIERAAAISITAHLVGFVPALIIGSYYLLRGSVNLGQLRRQVSEATNQSGDRW